MAAQVLSFFQRSPRYAPQPADWSQQELAEFYRVESALIRAGIRVGTDRGLSDENEPWFVFYRADDGEVVIHFARIDGEYLIAGPAYEEIARGFDFTSLVRNLVARHPLIRRSDSGSNLSVHPAALLVAVVGTAFFKTGEARAAETGQSNATSGHNRPVLLSSSSNASLTTGVAPVGFQQPAYASVQLPANEAVLVLAAALLASDFRVDAASLDPAVRSGLTAAAAALDFSDASALPAGISGFGGGASAPPPPTQTVDNTPVHAVSSVLSLVALLSTMPSRDLQPADAVLGVVTPARADAVHVAPVGTDASWALDVRIGFSLSGLPTIDAVQLVRGLVGDGSAQKISVIEVSELPNVLAEIVAKSTHYTVVPTPSDAADAVVTPVVVTPPPAPTPVEGGTSAEPVTGEITPPKPVEPATPAPVYASIDMVKAFIDYFIAHTGEIEVMKKDAHIVMFDARVLHDVGRISQLESVTYDFADGSSISLVGDHSSFLHLVNLI
ncbi:hypothetical protein [Caulobacter vibrioides]|uniref:Uncharacterized protein n=3 Tax=Caulobacter vibrioides TaxID=155892 RepID=Q9A9H5_CAUVC|nr:hypothetical protein [Caulobacter vibrioides]YP_002516430.1 hypothetical protein CCNA_01057 [Caulobacter vibrioides NA1000]AAK22989.1 hypothetical protein CC_1005 [Caulobacter vibrioides CB15]AAK72615.1 Sst1 [Caulobacter vibrioides NA1000]ACL94522.1 hypothetical protein CCNA_01057 [Caulobacter vibrioides NA1000]ATC27839.1 hypothetical protein CA607_05360 [Caulobacter vibrioides]QXZ53083.1 hypothetical protein KZH45_05275 [Caulobacter vibrioides]